MHIKLVHTVIPIPSLHVECVFPSFHRAAPSLAWHDSGMNKKINLDQNIIGNVENGFFSFMAVEQERNGDWQVKIGQGINV